MEICTQTFAPGQLPSDICPRKTAPRQLLPDNCPQTTAPGQLPLDNCPQKIAPGQLPPNNCPPTTAPGQLPLDNCPRTIAPSKCLYLFGGQLSGGKCPGAVFWEQLYLGGSWRGAVGRGQSLGGKFLGGSWNYTKISTPWWKYPTPATIRF